MIKAVVFDFFGVIAQSTEVLIHEEYKTTQEQNQQFEKLREALDYGYIAQEEYLKSYAEVVGISYEEMFRIYSDPSKRYGPSKKVLEYARSLRQKYTIALLSNITRESYLEFVDSIEDYFDVVVTSYQVKLAKPETAIYELCANRLGLDVSECVMIDDRQENCDGATAADMQAILFKDLKSLKKVMLKSGIKP